MTIRRNTNTNTTSPTSYIVGTASDHIIFRKYPSEAGIQRYTDKHTTFEWNSKDGHKSEDFLNTGFYGANLKLTDGLVQRSDGSYVPTSDYFEEINPDNNLMVCQSTPHFTTYYTYSDDEGEKSTLKPVTRLAAPGQSEGSTRYLNPFSVPRGTPIWFSREVPTQKL